MGLVVGLLLAAAFSGSPTKTEYGICPGNHIMVIETYLPEKAKVYINLDQGEEVATVWFGDDGMPVKAIVGSNELTGAKLIELFPEGPCQFLKPKI